MMWPVHSIRKAGKGWQPQGNYLRHGEMKRLLNDAGLRIVKVVGLGVLGGTICRRLAYSTALRLERWCAASRLVNWFGQDIIYVVCLDSRRGRSKAR
jgi:hypothetical protein